MSHSDLGPQIAQALAALGETGVEVQRPINARWNGSSRAHLIVRGWDVYVFEGNDDILVAVGDYQNTSISKDSDAEQIAKTILQAISKIAPGTYA